MEVFYCKAIDSPSHHHGNKIKLFSNEHSNMIHLTIGFIISVFKSMFINSILRTCACIIVLVYEIKSWESQRKWRRFNGLSQ